MSLDLAEWVRGELAGRSGITERRMFGGLAFLLHGHILVCVARDGSLLVRVESVAERDRVLANPAARARPMMMRSKMVARFLYIEPPAVSTAPRLRAWIARSSKALDSQA